MVYVLCHWPELLLCFWFYDSQLKTAPFFKTDADIPMVRESAYRRGLVPNAAQNAFLAMTTADISAVRQTEVRPAWKDGSARTARCSVFLKTTTNWEITPATTKATWSAWMAFVDSMRTVL